MLNPATRPVVHEVVDIRERDQTKTAERLEELVFEQKKLHEEMLAKQRSEFHKENLKLLNRLRNTEPTQPAQQTSSHTNLYIAISLLGGSLIGVLIAVAACYCCRRDTHETRSKDRNSSSSGNALHMTIWFNLLLISENSTNKDDAFQKLNDKTQVPH